MQTNELIVLSNKLLADRKVTSLLADKKKKDNHIIAVHNVTFQVILPQNTLLNLTVSRSVNGQINRNSLYYYEVLEFSNDKKIFSFLEYVF